MQEYRKQPLENQKGTGKSRNDGKYYRGGGGNKGKLNYEWVPAHQQAHSKGKQSEDKKPEVPASKQSTWGPISEQTGNEWSGIGSNVPNVKHRSWGEQDIADFQSRDPIYRKLCQEFSASFEDPSIIGDIYGSSGSNYLEAKKMLTAMLPQKNISPQKKGTGNENSKPSMVSKIKSKSRNTHEKAETGEPALKNYQKILESYWSQTAGNQGTETPEENEELDFDESVYEVESAEAFNDFKEIVDSIEGISNEEKEKMVKEYMEIISQMSKEEEYTKVDEERKANEKERAKGQQFDWGQLFQNEEYLNDIALINYFIENLNKEQVGSAVMKQEDFDDFPAIKLDPDPPPVSKKQESKPQPKKPDYKKSTEPDIFGESMGGFNERDLGHFSRGGGVESKTWEEKEYHPFLYTGKINSAEELLQLHEEFPLISHERIKTFYKYLGEDYHLTKTFILSEFSLYHQEARVRSTRTTESEGEKNFMKNSGGSTLSLLDKPLIFTELLQRASASSFVRDKFNEFRRHVADAQRQYSVISRHCRDIRNSKLNKIRRDAEFELQRYSSLSKTLIMEYCIVTGLKSIDLHGFYVHEAEDIVLDILGLIREGIASGKLQKPGKYYGIEIITGKGSHSLNRVAKIHPAIVSLLRGEKVDISEKEGKIIAKI